MIKGYKVLLTWASDVLIILEKSWELLLLGKFIGKLQKQAH